MKTVVLVLILLVAACGDDAAPSTAPDTTSDTVFTHVDARDDCRFSFDEGDTPCGPGADITSITVDASGPIVITIELSEPPVFDDRFQWLVEFSVSDLACGLTNTESSDTGFVATTELGPYGYRTLTNETAPPGACDGSLEGSTATLVFNIQPPLGPWTVVGGTQRVELANLDDPGSSDDVAVDPPASS